MNTAVYLPINNYSKLGEMGISRYAVRAIANRCVEKAGASLHMGKNKGAFKVEEGGAKVSLSKDGVATISLDVSVKAGNPVTDICTRIQQEISETMALMLDTLPIEVKVRVVKVID